MSSRVSLIECSECVCLNNILARDCIHEMALGSRVVVIILAVVCALQTADSSNILGYLASPSRSHYIVHESLLKGLAAKGHNVSNNRFIGFRLSFD